MAYDGKNDKDDFWDLDKLVPRKRGTLSTFASSDPIREEKIPAVSDKGSTTPPTPERDPSERKITGADRGVRSSTEEEYIPEGDSLIKRVVIRHFVDKYDFYDNFRKTALIYYDYRPTARAEFVQFYSYMPQYSQLNPGQKAYYFFWRGEMQRGRFIKTDYSYVYLYVYEILNLPDKIPPSEGIMLLCRLWREYRKALPRLDMYFSIWVQDYCLVHKIACPMDEINDFIFDVISASSFKEFYLSDINRAGGAGTAAMLAYLSDYDWRRGKYAAGDPDKDAETKEGQAKLYRAYMEGAMTLLLRDLWGECISAGREGKTVTVRRDAFPNSLCTHMVKRKLEIEYYPIAEADGLRRGVTAAVKYAENKIRAVMGIKSRLSVKDLPNDYRRIIDYYFEAILEGEKKRRERENAPEYMRLYDAPAEKMSSAGADEIERASWDTTMRLVDGMDGGEVDTDAPTVDASATAAADSDQPSAEDTPFYNSTDSSPVGESASSCDADTYGLGKPEIAYIATLAGVPLAAGYETDTAATPDTLAEIINEAFSDGFGDVIIEPSDDGYTVIEDYREDIIEWLYKVMK